MNQPGIVFWLTGLSGSGKSTLSRSLEKRLHSQGFLAKILDGDNVRQRLCSDLGFSLEDRAENIRRVSEVAKLFVDNGQIVICSFISPEESMRNKARQIIGSENFRLVFVDTPLDVCIQRDTKGLYKMALEGKIENFTGISAPYENPQSPDLLLQGDQKPDVTLNKLYGFVLNTIQSMQKN